MIGTLALSLALSPAGAAGSHDPAQPVRIGVVVPAVVGSAHEEWKEQLADGLSTGITRANFEAVAIEPGCPDAACWAQRAASHDVPGILMVTVGVADNDYRWTLSFIDAASGAVETLDAQTCEVCSVREASDQIARGITALRSAVLRRITIPAHLSITSEPSGALLFSEGVYLGTTPLEVDLPPGELRLEANKVGYQALTRRVDVIGAQESSVHLRLLPTTLVAPAPRFPRLWPALGGSAIAAGAVGVVAGSVLIGLQDRPYRRRCDGADIDEQGDCRFVYKTRPVGGVALGVGVALVVSGTLAVLLRARARQRARHAAH